MHIAIGKKSKSEEDCMRFFRENSDSIVKLYINQIGVAIFSMFLYTAAAALSLDGVASMLVKVGISVFAILFYFSLVYTVAWEIGAKDKIRIDAGRMEEKKTKGLYIGLWANSPNFVFIGLAFVLFAMYMVFGVEALYSIFVILNGIFRIFVSMYLGVIQGLTEGLSGDFDLLIETALYVLFSLIGAVVTYLSYLMGLKDKRLFPMPPKNNN